MKLLSPAGNMESLKMAVFNGADEVYLGIKDFNARNIEGFSIENLKQAVDFCHIYGVKVFLTVNILFSNEEIQSATDLIVDANNLGVDAFIIQDIGLANIIHTNYPSIEMHASTQMGIHNLEGVKAIENLGFKRVVLSRETPIEEIKRIRQNSNIEIEYFVQGALCVSFSGNCYMSSYMFNASGNRGKCKQLCRLPYSFNLDGKQIKTGYLLSAKEFNMINRLKDLEQAGVNSIKIEGRARRPYYVGVATKMYKQALNNIHTNNEIELAFNRGYVEGYFNGNSGIISNRQNHVGIEIGKVEQFNSGKKFNQIIISSNRELNAKSSFKILGKDEVVISAYDIKNIPAQKGFKYLITTTQKVKLGDKINLINDFNLEQVMLGTKVLRPVNIEISAQPNKPIMAKFNLFETEYTISGEICKSAKNYPLTKDEIVENFNKTEYFYPNINAKLNNVFIPKSKLNEFRRNVYEKLFDVLTKNHNKIINKTRIKKQVLNVEKFKDYQLVYDTNEKFNAKNIILFPEDYSIETIENFIEKCKQENKNPILNLINFATEDDVKYLKNLVETTKITIMVNNLYALNFNTKKIISGGLNVYNNYTANYFNLPFVNAEGEDKFKMPYMTLRHCPMKEHLNASCSNCPFRHGYSYKMQNGNSLKLRRVKLNSCTFFLTD